MLLILSLHTYSVCEGSHFSAINQTLPLRERFQKITNSDWIRVNNTKSLSRRIASESRIKAKQRMLLAADHVAVFAVLGSKTGSERQDRVDPIRIRNSLNRKITHPADSHKDTGVKKPGASMRKISYWKPFASIRETFWRVSRYKNSGASAKGRRSVSRIKYGQ